MCDKLLKPRQAFWITLYFQHSRGLFVFSSEWEDPQNDVKQCNLYMDADKSLARRRRKQDNISIRMAWISFGALPCRGKKTWWQLASRCCWNRARPWRASKPVSFLVGLRTYQCPPRYCDPTAFAGMLAEFCEVARCQTPHTPRLCAVLLNFSIKYSCKASLNNFRLPPPSSWEPSTSGLQRNK